MDGHTVAVCIRYARDALRHPCEGGRTATPFGGSAGETIVSVALDACLCWLWSPGRVAYTALSPACAGHLGFGSFLSWVLLAGIELC